ncbi:MAG: carboxypeptidase regulatory-like domain-containing protein [Acidobacteriota bacterium]|nr:carboxypeptidase regulatory-like domain-containing protein [Acidobacteriota bacterium]
MKASRLLLSAAALLFIAATLPAETVTGIVTNKTTGKPAAGDTVVAIDVQAGMAVQGTTKTDAKGQYSLTFPGTAPHLIRVTHQGATYFIAAPQGGGSGDIDVYDAASKVDGVSIEADVFEIEADNSGLHVTERFFVHNQSSPPRTEWSEHTFEIVLPPDATITAAAAQRPTGLPTGVKLDPVGPKGHYAFATPIEPDRGDKDTLFQVSYDLPYSSGQYTFHISETLPAQSVGVLLPKSMTFTAGSGSTFQSVQQDPGVQTMVARNAVPGKPLEFTVSGTGSMPREQQTSGTQTSANAGQPGGGIGEPINTPDPLTKYKWWILGVLAIVLAAGAAFLLRKPAGAAAVAGATPAPHAIGTPVVHGAAATAYAPPSSSTAKNNVLLSALKEELFALETEKLSGSLSPAEYAETKAALEVVLKRALKRNS